MLYKIAHILRDHFSFLWEWIEAWNSMAFRCKYAKGLRQMPNVLTENARLLCDKAPQGEKMDIQFLKESDAASLASFFANQPEEYFTYFRPHGFDEETLTKLIKRTSFIMVKVTADEKIVGYFFLRSFVHGRCFLGKIVDQHWQGKGIGKVMCKTAMDLSTTLGIRMFESINKNNLASFRSSTVLRQVIVEELAHGDLLIEDKPL